jgi:hypothetical protein
MSLLTEFLRTGLWATDVSYTITGRSEYTLTFVHYNETERREGYKGMGHGVEQNLVC